MLKRIAVTYSATSGWFIDLPTWQMKPGTFAPVTPGLLTADGPLSFDDQRKPIDPATILALGPTAVADVPGDWFEDGKFIGVDAFRAMYAGSRFGLDTYTPPAMVDP